MKYKIFCVFISMFFLSGCGINLLNEIETLPVEDTVGFQVRPIETEESNNQLAAVSSVADWTDNPIIIETVGASSANDVRPSFSVENLHLKPSDENYLLEAAYYSGNLSGLNDEQIGLLQAVGNILGPLEGLPEKDIVVGVHDALVKKISYGLGNSQYTAYGALVDGVAVCQGYASAFKLLMDIAGIDCITVGGTAITDAETVAHAWNMVRLNGKWYHVDVTWDDPETDYDMGICHTYLFIDDGLMVYDHAWNSLVQRLSGVDTIPRANDRSLMIAKNGHWFKNQESLQDGFLKDYQSELKTMEYVCEGFEPDLTFIKKYSTSSYVMQKLGGCIFVYIKLN